MLRTQQSQQGVDTRRTYQIVLWYASGCAFVTLMLFTCSIRVGKAESDLTADEKRQAAEEIIRHDDYDLVEFRDRAVRASATVSAAYANPRKKSTTMESEV